MSLWLTWSSEPAAGQPVLHREKRSLKKNRQKNFEALKVEFIFLE